MDAGGPNLEAIPELAPERIGHRPVALLDVPVDLIAPPPHSSPHDDPYSAQPGKPSAKPMSSPARVVGVASAISLCTFRWKFRAPRSA